MKSLRATSEIMVIGGLVVAAHLALVSPDLESGLESAGSAGADLLQVMASNANIASLVEAWDRPPPVETVSDMREPKPILEPPAQLLPDLTAETAVQTTTETIRLPAPLADAPPLPITPSAEPPEYLTNTPTAQAPLPPASSEANLPAEESRPLEATSPPSDPKPPMSVPKPDPLPPVQPSENPRKPEPPAPAKKPAAKAAPQNTIQINTRRAQGSGGDTAKGHSGSEQAATQTNAKHKSLLKKWGQQIRNRVARKAPKGVGKGRAVVQFTVTADGTVSNIRLAKSSGNTRIDQAALKSVRSAGRMPRAPKGLGVSSMPVAVPIVSK